MDNQLNKENKTEEKIINETAEITPQQLFDEATEVLQNSLKIMNGKYGGGFFIRYLQDVGSKQGVLQLIIQYPDNQYKTVLLCKNVFKVADIEGNGLGTVGRGTGEAMREVTPLRTTSFKDGDYRMLEKYETPQMPIPAQALWKQIIDNYERIPIVQICQKEDIEGIYWELYRIAHEYATGNNFRDAYRENDVCFFVTRQEMSEVAVDNGMTLSELRTELNLLGLLIKDKGSTAESGKRYNSYQLTKKINGKTERYYALKKHIKKTELKIDESCAVDFTEEYLKTPVEIELEMTKTEIQGLKDKIAEKEKKIKDLYQNRIDDATQAELLEHCV